MSLNRFNDVSKSDDENPKRAGRATTGQPGRQKTNPA
jgi:hypothetical protein